MVLKPPRTNSNDSLPANFSPHFTPINCAQGEKLHGHFRLFIPGSDEAMNVTIMGFGSCTFLFPMTTFRTINQINGLINEFC